MKVSVIFPGLFPWACINLQQRHQSPSLRRVTCCNTCQRGRLLHYKSFVNTTNDDSTSPLPCPSTCPCHANTNSVWVLLLLLYHLSPYSHLLPARMTQGRWRDDVPMPSPSPSSSPTSSVPPHTMATASPPHLVPTSSSSTLSVPPHTMTMPHPHLALIHLICPSTCDDDGT